MLILILELVTRDFILIKILKLATRDFSSWLNFKGITLIRKELGVQGLQPLSFCVVTVNDKHTDPRFKRKRRA